MSRGFELSIAAVTSALRSKLQERLDQDDVKAALGSSGALVTAVAPDTIPAKSRDAQPVLNLFLYRISHSPSARVEALPPPVRGGRATAPLLALELDYLLSAHGAIELQAEVLIGHGVQLLHEAPVVAWREVADRLPPLLNASHRGAMFDAFRIVPLPMETGQLARLWSALQSSYRPSVAYTISLVLHLNGEMHGLGTRGDAVDERLNGQPD